MQKRYLDELCSITETTCQGIHTSNMSNKQVLNVCTLSSSIYHNIINLTINYCLMDILYNKSWVDKGNSQFCIKVESPGCKPTLQLTRSVNTYIVNTKRFFYFDFTEGYSKYVKYCQTIFLNYLQIKHWNFKDNMFQRCKFTYISDDTEHNQCGFTDIH